MKGLCCLVTVLPLLISFSLHAQEIAIHRTALHGRNRFLRVSRYPARTGAFAEHPVTDVPRTCNPRPE